MEPETVDDGYVVTTLIARPCWLYVWLTTDPDGMSWLSVYRSVRLRVTDDWYQGVLELTSGVKLLKTGIEEDEHMMGYKAELSIYGGAA